MAELRPDQEKPLADQEETRLDQPKPDQEQPQAGYEERQPEQPASDHEPAQPEPPQSQPDQGHYQPQGDQQPEGQYQQQGAYQAGSGQYPPDQAQYQQQGQYQDPQGQYWANQEQYGQQGQYQQPGQYGQQAGWIPAGPQQPLKRNTLGIVALVAAIVGFIFAVWEGAFIIGWILLPIAFVISLVALFQKGQGKKLAITALIISIIGTIAGVLAFFFSAATVFEEAFDEVLDDEIVAVDPDDDADEMDDSDEVADDDGSGEGSRANPYPLGTTVSSDDWKVTVNSFTTNATDEVMQENEFNDEPDEGEEYVLVNVTVERVAEDGGSPLFDVDVKYVTESGNVISSYDSLAVVPDALPDSEMYGGATATGNVGLLVPEDDDGTIRVNPGLFADEVFFATS